MVRGWAGKDRVRLLVVDRGLLGGGDKMVSELGSELGFVS